MWGGGGGRGRGDGFLLFSHVERKVRLHSTWMRVPKGERRKLNGGSGVERAESSVGPAKPPQESSFAILFVALSFTVLERLLFITYPVINCNRRFLRWENRLSLYNLPIPFRSVVQTVFVFLDFDQALGNFSFRGTLCKWYLSSFSFTIYSCKERWISW